jgi:hypothetical protein
MRHTRLEDVISARRPLRPRRRFAIHKSLGGRDVGASHEHASKSAPVSAFCSARRAWTVPIGSPKRQFSSPVRLTASEIDQLTAAILAGSNLPDYDLNDDARIDRVGAPHWALTRTDQ